MKGKLLIATGIAVVAAAIYYFKFRNKPSQPGLLEKENERKHLTNVFSKAKEVAIGN